jgi:hypothetical protein
MVIHPFRIGSALSFFKKIFHKLLPDIGWSFLFVFPILESKKKSKSQE